MNKIEDIKLRRWQSEAASAWVNAGKKGIVKAVPGAGKTMLGLKLYFKELKKNPELRLLIVCPRLTLVGQWIKEIEKFDELKSLESYRIDSKTITGAADDAGFHIHEKHIFTSTFRQVYDFFKKSPNWAEFDWFLIVDELHNSKKPFPDGPKFTLGLSATPEKKENWPEFNLGPIVYRYGLREAFSDTEKVIIKPKLVLVNFDVSERTKQAIDNLGASQDITKINQVQDLVEEDFFSRYLSKKDQYDEIGIQKILSKMNLRADNFLLVFLSTTKKCDELKRILQEEPTFSDLVEVYHSNLKAYHKEGSFNELKERCKKRHKKILIVVETISEGVDFPYANFAILAKVSLDPTSFIQKLGRLLRTYGDQEVGTLYYFCPMKMAQKIANLDSECNYFKELIEICDEMKSLYQMDPITLEEKPLPSSKIFESELSKSAAKLSSFEKYDLDHALLKKFGKFGLTKAILDDASSLNEFFEQYKKNFVELTEFIEKIQKGFFKVFKSVEEIDYNKLNKDWLKFSETLKDLNIKFSVDGVEDTEFLRNFNKLEIFDEYLKSIRGKFLILKQEVCNLVRILERVSSAPLDEAKKVQMKKSLLRPISSDYLDFIREENHPKINLVKLRLAKYRDYNSFRLSEKKRLKTTYEKLINLKKEELIKFVDGIDFDNLKTPLDIYEKIIGFGIKEHGIEFTFPNFFGVMKQEEQIGSQELEKYCATIKRDVKRLVEILKNLDSFSTKKLQALEHSYLFTELGDASVIKIKPTNEYQILPTDYALAEKERDSRIYYRQVQALIDNHFAKPLKEDILQKPEVEKTNVEFIKKSSIADSSPPEHLHELEYSKTMNLWKCKICQKFTSKKEELENEECKEKRIQSMPKTHKRKYW